MNNKNGIDTFWEDVFDKYNTLQQIEEKGFCIITAEAIREIHEPRLMAKQDHKKSRPQIFKENQLSILPVTRGSYIIGAMDLYEDFSDNKESFYDNSDVISVPTPDFIESINFNEITSEATAINSMYVSNILQDFLSESTLVPTVNGRMGSGVFSFQVNSIKESPPYYSITVNNSQIEIDGGYESRNSLCIIEAKNSLSEDFLIRQLYYPYRLWSDKIIKPVRPIFLSFSNGIYHLFEYAFEDTNNYNSLKRIQYKKYKIENEQITLADILEIPQKVAIVQEPDVPFPQADSIERLINLCELMKDGTVYDKNKIAETYGFNIRQSDYYANAGRYLGLIQKQKSSTYCLSKLGKQVFDLSLKNRNIRIAELIISHKAFRDTLFEYVKEGNCPSKEKIIGILRQCKLYNNPEKSYFRRSSTIINWINWILNLQTD